MLPKNPIETFQREKWKETAKIINCATGDKTKTENTKSSCWFRKVFSFQISLPVEDYFLLCKFLFPSPISLFLNCLCWDLNYHSAADFFFQEFLYSNSEKTRQGIKGVGYLWCQSGLCPIQHFLHTHIPLHCYWDSQLGKLRCLAYASSLWESWWCFLAVVKNTFLSHLAQDLAQS